MYSIRVIFFLTSPNDTHHEHKIHTEPQSQKLTSSCPQFQLVVTNMFKFLSVFTYCVLKQTATHKHTKTDGFQYSISEVNKLKLYNIIDDLSN